MSADRVSIAIEDGPVLAALELLGQRIDDMRPALRSIGRSWLTNIQSGFRSGSDPYGNQWAPVRRGGQPLRLTGILRDSFSFDVDGDGLRVGTNIQYAPLHQFGGEIRAKNHPYLRFKVGERWVSKKSVTIPARKMLPDQGLPETWQDDALDAMSKHLFGGKK